MRTITTAQNVALTSNARKNRFRLWVDATGSGSYQDMSSFLGYDWLLGGAWSENIDNPGMSGTFRIARAVHDMNLSPFMGNSKANNGTPLLYPGRTLYLEAAVLSWGVPLQPSVDYVRVFDGYIDKVDPHDLVIELTVRDKIALIQDTFIETQWTYPGGNPSAGRGTGATALHTVIQQILDDHINNPGLGSVTLNVPVAPTFLVNSYIQQKQSVYDAIQTLAQLIGWDIRYKWDSGSSTFKLTLWTPNRANTTAARTFGPSDYYDLSQLALDRADVRNVVSDFYNDISSGARAKVSVSDSTSISTFGRRYMELNESATSQINNSSDATTLVNAALSDLSMPMVDHGVVQDYFFAAELGDLYAYSPNNKIYDSQQKLAVIQIDHEFEADGKATTTLLTRGKPSTGYRRWLRIEGRPGVSPGANYVDPSAPNGISVSTTMGAVVVQYTPPNLAKWAKTLIYMSTSSGNVPDPGQNGAGKNLPMNSVYLVASGRQTAFTVNNLLPSYTYYFRLQIQDTDGNLSAVSGLQQIIAEGNGPWHTNQDGGQAILNPNHDFNIFTKVNQTTGLPLTYPDCWGPADSHDAWGSSKTVYYDTSSAQSGKYCLTLWTGQGGGVASQQSGIKTASPWDINQPNYIPVSGGDILMCGAWIKWPSMPPGFTDISVALFCFFYDGSHAPIFAAGVDHVMGTGATSWYLGPQFSINVPTNARYAVLFMTRYDYNSGTGIASSPAAPWGTGTPAIGVYIDRISMTRGLPLVRSYPSAAGSLTTGASANYFINTWDNTNVTTLGWSTPVDVALSQWSCNIAALSDVHYNANLTFGTNGTVIQFWIDYYDPSTATWSPQTLVTVTGNNGDTRYVELSARVNISANGLIRIVCIANFNTLIDYASQRLEIVGLTRTDNT